MKKWPRFRDIFSLQPPEEPNALSSTSTNYENQWQKIKFDNTIRIWIALPSYLACYVLWLQNAIPSLWPMTYVFVAYGALQFVANWYFMNSRFGRKFDYAFCSLDLLAMSLSVFFTGGTNSPLYFIYFIPLIVHAFHRDWGVVVFNGFGGVVLYAIVVWYSLGEMTPALITNLGARLFFMLLTVCIACLALTILQKQDSREQRRRHRLTNLTLVSETLNHMASLSEIPEATATLTDLANQGLGESINPIVKVQLFQGVVAPKLEELQQENNQSGSYTQFPIAGTENESFGVLSCQSPYPNVFHKEEMQFLEFIAKSLGLSIQRLNRMDELRKSLEMNSWVMAATIASSRSCEETFQTILEGILTVLKADSATLELYDTHTSSLRTVKAVGGNAVVEQPLSFELRTIKGETLGRIKVARSDAQKQFNAIEIETAATFSARAALALENALTHEMQRAQIQNSSPEQQKAA